MELRERNHFRHGAGGIMPQGSEIGLGTDSANPNHSGQPRPGRGRWLKGESIKASRILIIIGLLVFAGVTALWISQLSLEDAYSPTAGSNSEGLAELGVIYIGSQAQPSEKKSTKPNVEQGLLITEVKLDGPAQKAGLHAGDLLVALNETPVKSSDSLVALLAKFHPGDQVELVVLRQNERLKLKVTLATLK